MTDSHSHSVSAQGEGATNSTSSSLGLLDAQHIAVFRTALDRILLADNTETTFSEIIDGLPTRSSWLDYCHWEEEHPIDVLGHTELCAGSREKARKFCAEFDIHVLSFPTTVCLSPSSRRNNWMLIFIYPLGPPRFSTCTPRD